LLKLFTNRKKTFLGQVFTLGSGTLFAQIITSLSYLVLTRIYSPDDIGVFSFFHSAAIVLSIIGTATYEHAIILPKRTKYGIALFRLSAILLSGLVTLLSAFVLFIRLLNVDLFFGYSLTIIVAILIGCLFIGFFNIFNYWFIRLERYDTISISKLLQALCTSIGQIFFGFYSVPLGLILGFLSGRFISLIYYKLKSGIKLFKRELITDTKSVSIKYSKQPKFYLLSRILSQGANESPIFLIAYFFDSAILGFYGLAYRVLSVPTTYIGTSVGHVFFKRFSHKVEKSEFLLKPLFLVWSSLFVIGIIPILLIFLFGPDLFELIFGIEWRIAGEIAGHLSPVLFLKFITGPTEKTYISIDKQQYIPMFSTIDFVGRVAGLLIGGFYSDFFLSIKLLVIFQTTSVLILNLFLIYFVKIHDNNIISNISNKT